MRCIYILLLMIIACQQTAAGSNGTKLFRSDVLSSTLISGIEQDEYGFIWIATEYGLNRYDGYTFRSYFHQSGVAGSLADDNVHNVVSTADGSLWVCSSRLQRYNLLTDDFDNVDCCGARAAVADVVCCADTTIYAVGYNGELYTFSRSSAQLSEWTVPSRQSKGMRCFFICADADGRTLWIGGPDGLMSIDRRTQQTKRYGKADFEHQQASCAYVGTDGTLYIHTPVNIFRYNRATDSFSRLPLSKPASLKSVRCMAGGRGGSLLFGTFGSGVFRYDDHTGTFSNLRIDVDHYDLSSTNVSAIYTDRRGNLWVGCFQKGLVLMPHQHTAFTEVDSRSLSFDNHNSISLIADAGNGQLWVAQGNNGLHRVTMDGQLIRSYLPNTTPISIHRDSKGRLWLGLYDEGVGIFNPERGTIDKLPGFPYKRVRAIDEDAQGNLYFAMFNYGIYSININTGAENTLPAEVNSRQVMNLKVDSRGLLWTGGYEGIRCYDTKKRRAVTLPEGGPVGALINAIAEDRHGDMLIATSMGLYLYSRAEGTFRHFSKADGLMDDMVCDVQVTSDDEVWLSTYKCLSCYKIVSRQFVVYRKGNGLNGMAFLRSVGTTTADGRIVFAYDDGYIYFDPSKINEVEPLAPPVLSAISLPFALDDDTAADSLRISAYTAERDHLLRLKYDENVVVLHFLSLDHVGNDNLCLQYRLSGRASSAWMACHDGENSIQLGPLSPGRYDLEVRTLVNGVSSPSRHYDIRVGHPWYSSWWMWCIYALIFIGFVYQLFVGYNNYLIRRRNEERIKFFIDLTHELRSPTTLMLAPLQELMHRQWDEETGRRLRAIYRNGNRLLQLLNQILDVRKIDKGRMTIQCTDTNVVQYVGDVFHVFEYEAEKRHIRFSFTPSADDIHLYIDRAHFDKVVYNLLSNAFKFVADGGEISVSISERETDRGAEVDIRVTDNGPGIDPAEVDRVFERFYQAPANKTGRVGFGIGLNLCYNIVRLHHGTISVANRTDGQTGAVFTISLPVGSDHLSADELLQGESAFTSADPVKLIAAGIEAVPAGEESDGKDKAPRRRYTHTVLVADDDKEIVDYLSRALGVRYRVIACADGAEALNKTIERLPDIVISDINMPKVDGFSLLTRLKSNNITSHIPVILLTSLSEHENKVAGLQKGADAYIDKPFDVEELMAHVQGLIDTRAKLRGKFAGEQDQRGKVEQVRMQGVSDRLMEKVMQVINEKFSDPELNVEYLAEQVGMSRTQLHRRMKEITGLSCGDFIRNFRMEQAARLLREGDVYVSQICYAVGFSNATHFSTAFRKHFGVSPSEYVQGAAAGPAADEEAEKS